MQLIQFLFSLALIVGAFAVGVLAGWYRWAPRPSRSTSTREAEDTERPAGDHPWQPEGPSAARSTLFSPQGGSWPERLPVGRLARSSRTVVLPADHIDLRARAADVRGELGTGQTPVVAEDASPPTH